jgi:hypothetical protein
MLKANVSTIWGMIIFSNFNSLSDKTEGMVFREEKKKANKSAYNSHWPLWSKP